MTEELARSSALQSEYKNRTEESITHSNKPFSRTFAPLNTPLHRRRQTLIILIWLVLPWLCLYLSFILLRCHNWYILSCFLAYLTWMFIFQKYPQEGGLKQQWFRRAIWWKWFAGEWKYI